MSSHLKIWITYELTNCIHSQFVQKAGLSYALKVGSSHHAVDTLLDILGDTHALTDVERHLPQAFVIDPRHGWKSRTKP